MKSKTPNKWLSLEELKHKALKQRGLLPKSNEEQLKELANNYAKGNKVYEEGNREEKIKRAIAEGKEWKLKKL